jgi:hypothetical protein
MVGHLITGGEFEPEVLKFCPFSRASMHAQKILRIGGKYSFLRFRGKRPQFCEKLAQRNGYVCMCFIWRYVLQNCVKLLNFHKVSKLFKWISLSCRKTFPYILNFCIYYLLFHNYRTKVGIWTHLGHLKTFLGVENLISQISKSSNSRGWPGGGGMLKFRIDRYITRQ